MSGCWLAIFMHNNTRYVGHVGTDVDKADITEKAKSAWRDAVDEGRITPVSAFNPVGPNLPQINRLNLKEDAAEFYGLYEPNGSAYTVVLGALARDPKRRRIAKVCAMNTNGDINVF